MKKQHFFLIVFSVLFLMSACSWRAQNEITDDNISFPENSLKITEGFDRKKTDKGDGLTLLAVLEDEVRTTEGEWFVFNDIFSFSNQKAVVNYSLFDKLPEGYGEFDENISRRDYLAVYDFGTGTLGKPLDISDDENSYSYLEQNGLLWHWNIGEQGTVATGYDENLQTARRFTVPTDVWGKISPDGEYFYYISDGKLYRTDTSQESSRPEEVTFDTAFSPQLIYDIFQNENGEDYGLIHGIAGDLKTYSAVANLDSGKMLYMNTEQEISYIENGVFAEDKSQSEEVLDGGFTAYVVGRYEYDFGKNSLPYIKFLGNDQMLFINVNDKDMEDGYTAFDLWLYDRATGTKLGSARLTSDMGYAYITQAVPCPGKDAILLYLREESGESLSTGTEFYLWEFAEGHRSLNDPTVAEQEPTDGLLGCIIEEWDPLYFTPEECPKDLADLRERADELEERFGIKLKISEECKRFSSSYAITSVSEREKIDSALSVLEYELSKYPEDFFRQFVWDEVQGIELCLSGPLIGMDESVLDIGGGMTTIEGNLLILAIDCTEAETMGNTLHHEIAHAIDRKLQYDCLLDETEWEALNPFPNMYSYSYKDYMDRDYEAEGLFDYIYITAKTEDTYFIDIYGLTYPEEDRAQIFAYAMSDGNEDIQQYPQLQKKLDFYVHCIQLGFDTKKWGTFPQRFMTYFLLI